MTFSPKDPYQPPEEEPNPNGKTESKEFEEAPPLPPLTTESGNGLDDDPDIFKQD